jgi:hypothetical protein
MLTDIQSDLPPPPRVEDITLQEVGDWFSVFLKHGPIAEMLLDRGSIFQWRPPPSHLKPMKGTCWENAWNLTRRAGWQYAVGMAAHRVDFPPVQHGWAVDDDGFVVDLTWHGPGRWGVNYTASEARVYYGVLLSCEDAHQLMSEKNALTVTERLARHLGYL